MMLSPGIILIQFLVRDEGALNLLYFSKVCTYAVLVDYMTEKDDLGYNEESLLMFDLQAMLFNYFQDTALVQRLPPLCLRKDHYIIKIHSEKIKVSK